MARASRETGDLAARGRDIAAKRGCLSCHTLDGQPHIGPSWAGLYDAPVRLTDGTTVTADVPYLTRSMMDPQAQIVDGYKPVMPTYRGILEEPEVAAIVELIVSLKDQPIAPSIVLPRTQPLGSAQPQEPRMTTVDITVPVPARRPAARESYLNVAHTVKSWALTTDHKRIGILYLVTTIFGLALGGVFALVLRTEHLSPGPTIVDAYTYNRLFTMHGIVMVWLFMIPSIPTAFGNFLLPIMIGAKDVAFPRLNLLSYYIYLVGSIWVLAALWAGGCDTGWTFYSPYSDHSPSAVVPTVFGIFILGWSTIITGVNFIVTTHTMRAKGVGWFRMPLFVWAMYGVSIIQMLATPVLAISLLVVGIDHWFDWGLFDPARGGDPVLYQHLFWFYSHPAVYIMILPAMGVISEVVRTFSHKNPASYKAIAYSTLGIAFVGFATWGHHMFVAGISRLRRGGLRRALDARGHLQRHQGVHLGAHDAARLGRRDDADALLLRLPLPLRLRRHDRRRRRDAEPRRALARHVLRRRPLPLHHGGRDADGLARGAALLVPEDHRAHVPRALGLSWARRSSSPGSS